MEAVALLVAATMNAGTLLALAWAGTASAQSSVGRNRNRPRLPGRTPAWRSCAKRVSIADMRVPII